MRGPRERRVLRTLPGEETLLYRPDVPDEQLDRVRQAAAACPVQAILVGAEVSAGAR
ncbi:ferredoxin [Streptomyces sp. NPDC056159]|uniref:ferredoxin n=1 Tax=Streptomyces sp. NPDC056159 TaxID=3155537 RepID=UPI003430988C